MEPELVPLTTRETFLTLFGTFYILPFIVFCGAGITTAMDKKHSDQCNSSVKRIEYIYPGFRIGCWLGQPVESK